MLPQLDLVTFPYGADIMGSCDISRTNSSRSTWNFLRLMSFSMVLARWFILFRSNSGQTNLASHAE